MGNWVASLEAISTVTPIGTRDASVRRGRLSEPARPNFGRGYDRGIVAETDAVLAIDIGGTKVAAGVVDSEGVLGMAVQAPTPRHGDAATVFSAVADLVLPLLRAEHGRRLVAVGVGCGGPMEAGGVTVSPLNINQWRRFPLPERLRSLVELPVFVDNDAKALALAEGWLGAARGVADYLAMVVSTGVGGGIVLGGRLLQGAAGNAGHIGHIVVEPDGYELEGHVRGVLEAEASGTAIEAQTGRPAAAASASVVERTGRLVGQAVGSVANLLDLRLAVVAGSVALGFGEPFFAAAQAEVDRVARLDHSRGARIVPAGLGDRGPLVGAGAVGWVGLGVDVLGADRG